MQLFHNCPIPLFFLLLLTIIIPSTIPKKSLVPQFLHQLLQQRFPSCTILHLNVGEILEEANSFLELEGVGNGNNDENEGFRTSFQVKAQLQGNESSRRDEKFLKRLSSLRDLHRLRKPCTVGLFFFSLFSPEISSGLYNLVNLWSPIIKKDEDHYVFLSPKKWVDLILLKSKLGTRIKYKFLLELGSELEGRIDGEHQFPVVKTTCFYCLFGEASIIPVVWGSVLRDSNTNSTRNNKDNKELVTFKFSEIPIMFPDLSGNFQGKTLQVGTPTGTRWLNEIRRSPSGGWEAVRGVYKIVMDQLMARYNFSCNFFPSKFNGGTGAVLPNGTWVGSVGSVLDGADIGHVTGQTWSRNKVVGFTYPVSYEMLTFTTGQPLPYFSWAAILWPLSKEMWIGLAVSIAAGNCLLLLLVAKSARNERFTTTHILTYTLASVVEQDVPSAERLKANPIRTFFSVWLFANLVISTAYRSKLVSLLSFPNVEEPPKTFEELVDSNYQYALQYLRGAAHALLKTSPNPTYKTLFARMQLEEDDVKCFERTIGQRFVCISWSRIADFVFIRNLSDQYGRVPVTKAPVTTCFLSVGIVTEKRAIFLTNFNTVIRRSTDSGLLEKWWMNDYRFVYQERRKWERSRDHENGNKTSYTFKEEGANPLTNHHFKGSYYLLSLGGLIALLVRMAEGILGRRNRVIRTEEFDLHYLKENSEFRWIK